MRPFVRPLLVFVLVILVPLPAWSIILEFNDGTKVKGHYVSSSQTEITIRFDGSTRTKTYLRRHVKVTQAVDPMRLSRLTPKRLIQYYEYANELYIQRSDPDARDTALRLFLICAYKNPDGYGEFAFRRMEKLARSPQEVRAFRAVAYAFSRGEHKVLLQKVPQQKASDEAQENLVKALRYLRRGKAKLALEHGQKAGVLEAFQQHSGLMSYDQFLKLCEGCQECGCTSGQQKCTLCKGPGLAACVDCKGKGWHICKDCHGYPRRTTLTAKQRRMILEIELAHASAKTGAIANKDWKTEPWSVLVGNGKLGTTRVLSVRHVTEFDPAKCVYRGGQWVKPE
ncbi:MAG: hypothetical protein ACFCD0_05400 [Gemmataceae bacterium]